MRIRLAIEDGRWYADRGNARVVLGPVFSIPLRIIWNEAVYWFLAPQFDGAVYAQLRRGRHLSDVLQEGR